MYEPINRILTHKATLPTAVGVASFIGGGIGGYILGKRNGDVFEISEEALHEVPDNQLIMDFDEDSSTPYSGVLNCEAEYTVAYYSEDELEEDAEFALEEDELDDAQPIIENVFGDNSDTWDYEAEKSTRTGDAPYVIHFDEFQASEMNFEQSTVTYYEGDDILSDEYDAPMYRWEANLGELNWGHGSGDSNVVYIRNEALEQEWEVLRHSGRFEVEVLGLSPGSDAENQLAHSVHLPRFRMNQVD